MLHTANDFVVNKKHNLTLSMDFHGINSITIARETYLKSNVIFNGAAIPDITFDC